MLATTRSLKDLQADLRRRHTRVRNLRLSDGADGVEVEGEASTYHALQLLIRDVVSLGITSRVRVRVDVRGADAVRAAPLGLAVAEPTARRVLIAAADAGLRAGCAARLGRAGFVVATAATGLECLSRLVTRRPGLLILIGRLPWGGSAGVLHLAYEEGYLDRMTVAYLGDRNGLDGLSETLLGKLAQVRLLPECDEDAVCGVASGLCRCAD